MDPKLVIVVSNSNKYPAKFMIPILKATWDKSSNIKIIYYQGDSNEFKLVGSDLYVPESGKDSEQWIKTIKAYEWVYNNIEFDILFGVTASSYLNFKNMISFLKDKPSNKLYCSLPNTYPPYPMEGVSDIAFGSGAGLFLSKDLVRLLIDKQNMVDSSLPNDVAYGKLFIHDHKITLTGGKRQDFRRFPRSKEIELEQYHYRFDIKTNKYPRYLEIFLLLYIHFNILKKEDFLKKILNFVFEIFFIFIFELLRLLNPLFFLPLLNEARYQVLKFSVWLIKSNRVSLYVARLIKRFLSQ
ncbi:hypothetical protein OAP09_01740 [Acidimicrobiia bacterium]|nr:hypothetical protein [Acidimicrobiia bacterium]